MEYIVNSKSPEETESLGERIALSFKMLPFIGGFIGLSGALGSGKTTLARGILRGLGWEKDVISPTYLIARYYNDPDVLHVDGYRIVDPFFEFLNLDIERFMDDGYLIIWEWGDPLKDYLPETLWVNLEYKGKGRKITVSSKGYLWQEAVKILQPT
ncbi:MAG: tRNA threonylcarbamoyladenosine biosynthesis protein TsaE [candidate division WS2 bacterium]|nr:tRNA threonylcarbamoyladenosine biosynthesis protein TsaE [Candidatus Lithacetigena glycinireducens]MBT9175088.1 tRNA threonylcarbamoyladenosine biosynthesis protein TsaE [Candidatus Lithacetigena glycinireducens]